MSLFIKLDVGLPGPRLGHFGGLAQVRFISRTHAQSDRDRRNYRQSMRGRRHPSVDDPVHHEHNDRAGKLHTR
jgi:hypothetical protein